MLSIYKRGEFDYEVKSNSGELLGMFATYQQAVRYVHKVVTIFDAANEARIDGPGVNEVWFTTDDLMLTQRDEYRQTKSFKLAQREE